MSESNLIIDGMLSGTGIRDGKAGGYIKPQELGLSKALSNQIGVWLAEYANLHFHDFADRQEIKRLDMEGLAISKAVSMELQNINVSYYSHAEMRCIDL